MQFEISNCIFYLFAYLFIYLFVEELFNIQRPGSSHMIPVNKLLHCCDNIVDIIVCQLWIKRDTHNS